MTYHQYSSFKPFLRTLVFLSAAYLAFLAFSFTPVGAVPVTNFNPGRIIEDNVFTNSQSMTVGEIQNFLNSKVPHCDTWGTQTSEFGGGTRAQYGSSRGNPPPFTCLKDYVQDGRTAAQIIYDTAQEFQINPQVFIVLLQKEQGLVTDTWPFAVQYRTATGYGCPDTAACDSQYFGLINQIRWSGRMFRAILNDSPTWYTPYILGNNYIRWSPNSACGGTTVNIENRSTQALYNYTPYQPNQAALNAGYGTGDGCSAYGNRNFFLYFRDWFGYNSGPAAFKTADSATIYIPVNGYKMSVPHMAIMQDFGISVESIRTVSQTYVDSIPTPPNTTGLSSSISHVIKSPYDSDEDGASVYLMTRGKRFQIRSMTQLYNLGFTDADVKFLPLSYIHAKPNGGLAADFIASPYGSIFKLTDKKQIIFEFTTYRNQNPSDQITPLSYYLIDKIPAGPPIVERAVLVKLPASDVVTLLHNDTYYSIPSYDVYGCWGFEATLHTPVYRLPQADYVASITPSADLGCLVNDSSQLYTLNTTNKKIVPSAHGLASPAPDADLLQLANNLPTAGQIKSYVKTPSSPAVWYLESGKRKAIPTYLTFTLLGLSDQDIDYINNPVLAQFTLDGIKLANGQLVKTDASAAVYAISDNQRIVYPTSQLFTAYGNQWDRIESFNAALLDQDYPDNNLAVKPFLYSETSNKIYLMATNGCYLFDTNHLTEFGKNLETIKNTQDYQDSIFKNINLASCNAATYFIKSANQNLVYWVNDAKKQPLSTYSSMLSKNGGTEPTVMVVDQSVLNDLPLAP